MNKLYDLFPKGVLAFLLISGGILGIIISSPPHSLCDSQLEVVNKSQQKFLFREPAAKKIISTKYERLREHCKRTNNPGGCYELFQELRVMVHDLATLSGECSSAMSSTSEYKRALWESAELIVLLAWGEKPPAAYTSKLGWLEVSDITLFCRMHDRIAALYGENAWVLFRERMMRELPGAKDLTRNQVWDLSIFSENCARYP